MKAGDVSGDEEQGRFWPRSEQDQKKTKPLLRPRRSIWMFVPAKSEKFNGDGWGFTLVQEKYILLQGDLQPDHELH